jgi:Ca2+-binding RTX toxin-like protein
MSGTATNGTDYTAIPTTVTFAAGSATALVNLTVIDDTLVEGPETATLTVLPGSGYLQGGLGTKTGSAAASQSTFTPSASATVTIADNDTGSTITLNAFDTGWYDSTGFHDPGNANYLAGDNNTSDAKLYRNWSTFNLPTLSGPIISAQLRLNTYDFNSPTTSETYELRAVATDVATLRAGGSGKTAIYADLADGNIYGSRAYTNADDNLFRTIDLNAAAISAITVKSGQAFALGGWINTLDTIDNYEGAFGFSLGNVGDVQLILNIGTPPPAVVTLAANYSGVSENGTTNLIYTFTRTGANANALTVNYAVTGTATLGTDYSGIAATPATVTFAANSSTATVTVDPISDTTIEANETVVLTLATGTGYTIGTPGPVTTTILNDDGVINQQGTLGNDVIAVSGITRILSGRAGNDILTGSNLAETFIGGAGSDTITTGLGYDTVSFSLSTEGADMITDYNALDDIIQVSASGFGGGLTAGEVIDSSQFQLGTAATTSSHRFIYVQPTGQLFFDVDGNGSTMQTLLATLTPGSALTHQNIFAA